MSRTFVWFHTTRVILYTNLRDVWNTWNYCSTPESLASASNLAVQLFQPMFRHQFRIQHIDTSSNSLVIKRFALLRSADFLSMLSTAPKISETFLQLNDLNYERYRKFYSFRQNIASAIKVMKGRKSIDEADLNKFYSFLYFFWFFFESSSL
jgi:hypothetical protein